MNQQATIFERSATPVGRALPFGGLTDAQLLQRFLAERDEAVFELLVWRHGPMVMRVGFRVLKDVHRAEDVFQAAFFTLANKARTIGKQEAVSSWLYKVAYRLALRARAKHAKLLFREGPLLNGVVDKSTGRLPGEQLDWRELGPVVDAELQRLPEKLRAPFVLCYLQGKTNEEAAKELGCPKGTVLSRLARARERLRIRLTRRGLAFSVGVFALLFGPNTWLNAAEAPELVEGTVNIAGALLKNKAAAEVVPSGILDLMKQTWIEKLRAMGPNLFIILLLLLIGGSGTCAAAVLWADSSKNSGCNH
ncbi:MAG: RNA polymerase sigma factor [Gemmataceae bacterium]